MSKKISVTFSTVAGTRAGLGRTGAGRTLLADRPSGIAGGQGLGFNGAELLAASLGGCFWNDLHYAAAETDGEIQIDAVEAKIDIAGEPPRVVRAHICAAMSGSEPALSVVFEAARAKSTIANSLIGAFPIVIKRAGLDH